MKNRSGDVMYTGMTNDLHRRIKEHHYDKSKSFAYASVTPTRSKAQAKTIEKKRLRNDKPPKNKLGQ